MIENEQLARYGMIYSVCLCCKMLSSAQSADDNRRKHHIKHQKHKSLRISIIFHWQKAACFIIIVTSKQANTV